MKTILRDWISSGQPSDKLRELNYNMSYVLKELNSNDIYVKSFNTGEISLDDENMYPVEFNNIDKSDNIARDRDNNIYNLSFLFAGLYSNMLDYLKPEFLKENFDQFKDFLPPEDVSYYKGILADGYRVYYNDYIDEIRRKKANQQNVGVSNSAGSSAKSNEIVKSKQYVKSTAVGRAYRELYENKAGLASYLIMPIILLVIVAVVGLIFLFIS